ncbi:PREDICTED: uncharacterized protein LOC109183941 [Ipomoea nil]|uniref:uncharacterized protein LOC109183941 n=1 Tax=Ipomoea nil TaxID=35883 RepID=UPI00090161C4|nr:PREDICTED: uncharacterized protein LOC109183941 [Ipomoea nil]
MVAKGLICGGVRRRIGNGKSTLIWDHPWLHDENQQRILTEKPPQLAQEKVVGLMDQHTGTWDQEILTDIFIPQDVEQILKIPVSPDYEDMWYWYGDPRGEYSVKEGYKAVMGNYSQPAGTFDKWNKLWSLKVPPKWKTFLWRALNDILPTTENLLIKRVDIDPTCAMCGVEHENLVHSLITCGYTANIWAQSNLPIPNNVTNIFSDWFNDLINILDDDGIIYAVALLYYVCRTRNGAVWEANLPRPRKVVAMAMSPLNAWKVAHPVRHTPPTNPPEPPTGGMPAAPSRTPPPVRTPRGHDATLLPMPQTIAPMIQHHAMQDSRDQCYFDAAYDPRTNKATVGAVILNSQGSYVSAMTAPIIDCFSPLMAEAFACKEVLSWLRNRGMQSIDLYTDCLVLKQYLSATTHSSRSYLGYAIDSCRSDLLSFDYCLIHYIPRLDNYLAHILASTAFNQQTTMYADFEPPHSISAYFE